MIVQFILTMAKSDAEFDGRRWLSMPQAERRRYLNRSRASLAAALERAPEGLSIEGLLSQNFLDEDLIDDALNAK